MEYKKCKYKRYCIGLLYEDGPDVVKSKSIIGTRKILRKATYVDHGGSGYIIGECYKFEGVYRHGRGDEFDYDPPELVDRKRVDFYKVLVGYNHINLVNKNDAIIFDNWSE